MVDGPEFPVPDDTDQMENTWAVHQLLTSANFAQKSTLARVLCGGLNFQIEHHLFPNICHVHYDKIAPIVEKTAREHHLPYHSFPTYSGAVRSHFSQLRKLGR